MAGAAALREWWLRLRGPLLLLGSYWLASKLAHTLLLTIVTTFLLVTNQKSPEFANTINEIASQYTLIAYALAACLIAITVRFADIALYRGRPFWNEAYRSWWQLDRRSQHELYRGISSGILAVLTLILILFTANQINFLGIFITSAIGTPVFPLFLANAISLLAWLAAEEFIFRHKLLYYFQSWTNPLHAIVYTAALATLIRCAQFDLNWQEIFNLFILQAALSVMYMRANRVHRPLAFQLVMFGMLHPLSGLPIWGHSCPSFFLFKHTSKASDLLSGGEAGPLASVGMLSIFILLLLASFYRWRRTE